MNFIEASIFILLIAILAVPIANRFRIPLEIFLVIGSCLVSLTPGLPSVQLNPVVVFDIFLPPILFAAAYFTSWRDFKFNFRPIVLLAFGLVLCTTVVVAITVKLLIPGFSWAEGFLLGAIVSPTDASSATAIIKKLGAPRRVIVILEGESLVNDATALILYRFSLAAIIYGYFSFPEAIGKFAIVGTGGLVVGLVIGFIARYAFTILKDVQAETTFTFITAFSSYLIAEHFGFSGVIATVVSGIYFGLTFPEFASTRTRINAKASWSTLIFIINGFVFTLIGFQLPTVIAGLSNYSFATLLFYGGTISLVVILIRILWMYPAALVPRVIFPSINKKDPMPSWQFLLLVGWVGMRGIVSLAAVLAIPHETISREVFQHLEMLTFITYCVVVATLVLPTITLPFLLKELDLADEHDVLKEEAIARIRSIEGVIENVTLLATKENIPCEILEEFKKQFDRRLRVIETQLEDTPYSVLNAEYTAMKKLALTALESERQTLLQLRKMGEIHEEVFHSLMDELDIEELRTNSLRM